MNAQRSISPQGGRKKKIFKITSLNNIFYGPVFKFCLNKMSIIIEGKNISNNDDAEYVFEPTN